MPHLSRSERFAVVCALGALVGILVSCTHHTDENPTPPTPQASPTEGKEAASPARRDVAPALKELGEKLQPPGTAQDVVDPEATERQKQLYAQEVEQLVERFVRALDEGDSESLGKLLLTSEELESAVKPGVRPILAGSLLSTNEGLVEQLLERLKGTSLRHSWRPGEIVLQPPSSIYDASAVRALCKGTIDLTTQEGVELVVRLEQLVRLEGGWRLLQVSVP